MDSSRKQQGGRVVRISFTGRGTDEIEKNQIWFCHVCNKRGKIQEINGEDADTTVYRLDEAHRKYSPGCHLRNLQVVVEGLISNKERERVMAIPEAT